MERDASLQPAHPLRRLPLFPVQDVAERRQHAAPARVQASQVLQVLPRLTSMMAPRRLQAGPGELR